MIKVVKETWTYDKGFTKKNYTFIEDKMMTLLYKDDTVYGVQKSIFHSVEKDWNCDNDVYELFGAYFVLDDYNEFLTPENIVSLIEDNDLKVVYQYKPNNTGNINEHNIKI